jgi:hypothetical protein
MRIFATLFHSSVSKSIFTTIALLAVFTFAASTAQAQSLGYEGPTGVFVTPLASVSASPANGLGKPAVGYHFIAGGNGLGDYQTVSVTEGFAKRFEVGYTSEFHAGSYHLPLLTSANVQGFEIVHGKANLITSKTFGAISVGAIYRFNDHNLFDGSAIGPNQYQTTSNADFYVVGTKVFTGIKKVPVLFNAGLRGTNASLWGLAGNAPGYSARGFGALAFVFTLPNKGNLIVGSEAAQQPQRIKDGSAAILDVPTSVVYAVRYVPSSKLKLNIDAGVLHATSGHDGTDILANAKDRVAFGISYGF